MQQATRTGRDTKTITAEITGLWQRTDSGKAFAAALEDKGYILCPGDRRDFVIVDRQGEVHSLARRIDGATAKDVRARVADIDKASLLSIADARDAMREAARVERFEAKLKTRPLDPLEQRVDRVVRQGLTGRDFRDALGEAGIILAKVTERDAQNFAAMRKDNELKAVMGPDHILSRVPTVEQGEIVAVTRRGNVYRMNPQRLDPGKLEQGFGRSMPSVSDARDAWSFARDYVSQHRAEIQADRITRSKAFEAGRARHAMFNAVRRDTRTVLAAGKGGVSKGLGVIGRGGAALAALASAALGFLEGLFSRRMPPTLEQAKQSERVATENEKLAGFRQYVAEQTQRHSTIVDQSRAQQRERDQQAHDRTVRERRQRDDDRTR